MNRLSPLMSSPPGWSAEIGWRSSASVIAGCRRGRRLDLEISNFENWNLLVIHDEEFLSGRNFGARVEPHPIAHSSKAHRFVLMLPREGRQCRHEDFAQLHAGELRRRNDVCLHPHEIAKTARFADL